MNKKLILGIRGNRIFPGHIKSFLILLCVFLVLTSFVFAETVDYGYTIDSNEVDYFEIKDIDTSGSLDNWRCDFDTVPSAVIIGECYCLDTTAGIQSPGFRDTTDGFGYGDLFECLKFNNVAQIRSSATGWPSLDLEIRVNTYDNVYNPTDVTIEGVPQAGGTVMCDHTGSASLNLYTFYREKPFVILEKGLSNEYILPEFVKSGDSIKCQVSFYDGFLKVGSANSDNSMVIDDTSVAITSTYLAPANTKNGDTLYCYGNSNYDVNETQYKANHTFEFYKNGNLEKTESYLDDNGNANPFYANYSNFLKNDQIFCNYTVSIINSSSGSVVRTSNYKSGKTTIANSRPSIPLVSIGFGGSMSPVLGEDVRITTNILSCTAKSTDADLDPLSYSYIWYVVNTNGSLTEVGTQQNLSTVSYDMNNTVFMCEVYASDGESTSLAGRNSFSQDRDKTYIPFGVLDTEVDKIGPYTSRDAIPKAIKISTNQKFTYNELVSCYNGECGNLNADIVYTIFYLETLNDMTFGEELYGNKYSTLGTSLLTSDSNDQFSTPLNIILNSQYSEIGSYNSEYYTIEGKGDIPTAECTSFYEPYYILTATVNYADGSSEEVEDLIIYNNSVTSVVLDSKIYYDLPTGPIEVLANSETIFSSEDADIMSVCENGVTNCFVHVPDLLLDYPARTNLTATITDENLSALVGDSCLREKLRDAEDSIEVLVETPDFPKSLLFDPVYDNLCVENFDNLPLPIDTKTQYFDDSLGDIYPSENLSIELDLSDLETLVGSANTLDFETMIEVDIILTQNRFGEDVQTIQIGKTPAFNLSEFSTLFSSVDPSIKPRIDIIATYGDDGNEITGSTYFMINTSCNSQDANCTYYYTESGRREYYWAYDGMDVDGVQLIEKCGTDHMGSVVDWNRVALGFNEVTSPNGIVLTQSTPPNCNTNTDPATGDSSCYRVEKAGFYNMSISVDGIEIPYLYIEADVDCAFTTLNVLDHEYNANTPETPYEIMKGESFEVDELEVSCLLGAERQSNRYCKVFTAEEIYGGNDGLGLSIISNNTSYLSYNEHLATVGNCESGIVNTDFAFDSTKTEIVSFCTETQNDSTDFRIPPEHVRDTRCSTTGDEEIKLTFLGEHLTSYAARNITKYGAYILKGTLNNYVEYIETVIEKTDLVNYFKDEFVTQDGRVNYDALKDNDERDDFIQKFPDVYDLTANDLPDSSDTFKSMYPIKKAYMGTQTDSSNFFDDLSEVITANVRSNCTAEARRINNSDGSFVIDDNLKEECEEIALSIIFEPGVYMSETGEFEYCFVDWDTDDTACCDYNDVGRNPCVYNGTCYRNDYEELIDLDLVPEVCTVRD